MPKGTGAASGVVDPNVLPVSEEGAAISAENEVESPEQIKGDVEYRGEEIPLNLKREMSDGRSLKEALQQDLSKYLEQEIQNQQDFIDKIPLWERQYRGQKDEKTYPYRGCSNTAIPVTRVMTDATTVRIIDAVFGQKKAFIITPKKEEFVDLAPKIEDALEWWQKDIVNLKKKTFPVIQQAIKIGTGIAKMVYRQKKRTTYRYASPVEVSMKAPGLIKFPNGQYGIKKVTTIYDGPDVIPVDRAKWVISSDASTIEEAFLCGFQFSLRKPEIKSRMAQGMYYADTLENVRSADDPSDTDEARAKAAHKELKNPDSWDFWEIWMRYDVDEDGEEDDIVVTFHLPSKTIARAIYNPMFMGFRPFIAFVFNPVEYSFDGEGVCEIIEKLQEQIDTLSNQRIDRLNQINAPMYLVKEGAQLDDFTLAPGMIWKTNDDLESCVKELSFREVYPSTFQEESMLIGYAQQAIGVSSAVLGQSIAERPVAKDTMALIQETNKKFKFGIDNVRDDYGEIGAKALEMFAQYKPSLDYGSANSFGPEGVRGMQDQSHLDFPFEFLRDGINVQLTASSELMNIETRRENDLTQYQILSDYYTKWGGMVQVVCDPKAPPELKKSFIAVSEMGARLLGKILDDFGSKDANALIPHMPQIVNLQAVMQPPPPEPPPIQTEVLKTVNYADSPPDIQRQMEQMTGFRPSLLGMMPQSVLEPPEPAPEGPPNGGDFGGQ